MHAKKVSELSILVTTLFTHNRINTVHTCNLDKFLLRNVACLRREGDLFLVARRGVIDSFLVKKKNATHEMLFRILKFSCTLSNGWIQFVFDILCFPTLWATGEREQKESPFTCFFWWLITTTATHWKIKPSLHLKENPVFLSIHDRKRPLWNWPYRKSQPS